MRLAVLAVVGVVMFSAGTAQGQNASSSKLSNYGVLQSTGPAMTKTTSYAVLLTIPSPTMTKTTSYAVLQPAPTVTVPTLTKTVSYAVLTGYASLSKLVGYGVLCTPPGVGVCPALPVSTPAMQNGIDLGIPW